MKKISSIVLALIFLVSLISYSIVPGGYNNADQAEDAGVKYNGHIYYLKGSRDARSVYAVHIETLKQNSKLKVYVHPNMPEVMFFMKRLDESLEKDGYNFEFLLTQENCSMDIGFSFTSECSQVIHGMPENIIGDVEIFTSAVVEEFS